MCPGRLFIISGGELLSKEGTTQGDPTSIGAFALWILPLLYLIVKEDQLLNANALFVNSNVNTAVEGKRHLGAIVGNDNYKHGYVDELVKDWNSQLCTLSTVAESQPQAACSAFVNGFKNKLNYFIRTIRDISNLSLPIEDIIRNRFIPAITDGRMRSEEEQNVSCYIYQLDIEDYQFQFLTNKLESSTTSHGE